MNCKETIQKLFASLDILHGTPEQHIEIDNRCQVSLHDLPMECSEELVRVGQDLIGRINGIEWLIEEKLLMVLRAIVFRNQPEAFELVTAAFSSHYIFEKEYYVDLLDALDNSRAVPFLVSAIDTERSVEKGDTRFKAIRTLLDLEAKEAASTVMSCIADPVDKVRNITFKFLVQLDISEAAVAFVKQLPEEDDPDNMELLIEGVVAWKRTDALPTLQVLVNSDWPKYEVELGESLAAAIAALEQSSTQD